MPLTSLVATAAPPRFQPGNLQRNPTPGVPVAGDGGGRGVTAGQLGLAWVLAQGSDVVPIPGTKRVACLEKNVAAAALVLTEQDLGALRAVARVVGALWRGDSTTYGGSRERPN